MTLCAILRELRTHMIGIRGLIEVSTMTGKAGAGKPRVLAVYVAIDARDSQVRTGQRKTGIRMVEGRGFPCRGCMTLLTH